MDSNTSNILVVDDEKSNIDILLGLFENISCDNEFNIIVSLSGKKALKIVEKRKIDLILLDIMMPEMDGYEVCKILKSQEETKNIPILFITASTDDESIEKAYSLGAADYVTKPFRPIELLSRVKTSLKLQQTINELEHLAYYDSMTGVYNRRKFFESSNIKFGNADDTLYAIMCDIDKFKRVNDTYGHAVGDMVIKSVASVLKECLNEECVLGRLGGEEFAMMHNASSEEEIYEIVENLRKKIEKIEIINNDTLISCTMSFGIAKYNDSYVTIDAMLNKADEALYQAKESGRNKTIFEK
jgi:diguanylate cyclase (GGDEF)-like protein